MDKSKQYLLHSITCTPRRTAAVESSPRHLPPQRTGGSLHKRGPGGYRSCGGSRRQSNSSSCCSASAPASPALTRRHTASPSRRPARAASVRQPRSAHYRRLGDLSQSQQESVLALLCQQCERTPRAPLPGRARTSSLPDVLEEDSLSGKSVPVD